MPKNARSNTAGSNANTIQTQNLAFKGLGCSGAGVGIGMLRGRGIPLIETIFQSFLVSWFQSFLAVGWFGFLCSWFLGFTVPKFPRFVERYWSRITKFPFHVVWKILIPCPRFSRFYNTNRRDFRPRFSHISQLSDFRHFGISEKNNSGKGFGICSWIIWSILVFPRIAIIGFGNHGHVRKSRNHEDEGFSVSPIIKSTSY